MSGPVSTASSTPAAGPAPADVALPEADADLEEPAPAAPPPGKPSLLSRSTCTDRSATPSSATPSAPPTASSSMPPPPARQPQPDAQAAVEFPGFPVLASGHPMNGPTPMGEATRAKAAAAPAGRPGSGRKKVAPQPGYSQMHWLQLTRTHPDLAGRGGRGLRKITLEEIAQHNTPEDAWMALRSRVYNITPYLDFHPGGRKILLSAAGIDGTKLHDKYHRWVNSEFLLEKCLLGALDEGDQA